MSAKRERQHVELAEGVVVDISGVRDFYFVSSETRGLYVIDYSGRKTHHTFRTTEARGQAYAILKKHLCSGE